MARTVAPLAPSRARTAYAAVMSLKEVGFACQGIEDADALVDSLAAGAPLAAYEKRGEPAP